MENNSGCQVLSKQRKTGDNSDHGKSAIVDKDFINQLHYEVLIHIFSLLPLQTLVLASFVSKQWENLVKNFLSMKSSSVSLDELKMSTGIVNPYNNIVRSNLAKLPLQQQICIRNKITVGSRKFNEFVNRTLYLHEGCSVKKLFFNVCYDGLHNSRQKVDKWFHFSMRNEVKELHINFSNGIFTGSHFMRNAYEFPNIHATSNSLECLRLNCCKFITSNLDMFGYLQTLELKFVTVLGFTIEDLGNKCVMLKDLTLTCCYIPLNFMICRRDIKIRSLKIIKCSSQNGDIYPIDISAPELLIFWLEKGYLNTDTDIKATNLIEFCIAINHWYSNNAQRQALAKLLDQSSNCKTLSLNTWCIQVLSHGENFQQLQIPFNNLKHLKLTTSLVTQELPGIAWIMRNCPYMEFLTLHIPNATLNFDDLTVQNLAVLNFEYQYLQSQLSTCHCVRYCLKKVHIYSISRRSPVIKMLRFLVEHAKVLETIYLFTHREIWDKDVRQWFLAFQKKNPRIKMFMIDQRNRFASIMS